MQRCLVLNISNTLLKRPKTLVFFIIVFDGKTSLAEILVEKCPQKKLRSFWKKVKGQETSSKSITVLLEKSKEVKNFLKNRYGPFGKK